MSASWILSLSDVLKFMEKNNLVSGKPNPQVHKFRRSFEAGQKKDRVLTQLKVIYGKTYPHIPKVSSVTSEETSEGQAVSTEEQTAPDLSWLDWFNSQNFQLKLGQKTIRLKSLSSPQEFAPQLLLLFCELDPTLIGEMHLSQVKLFQNMSTQPKKASLISGRKRKKALRKIQGMSKEQLQNLKKNIPQSELQSLASNPETMALAQELETNPQLQNVVSSISN